MELFSSFFTRFSKRVKKGIDGSSWIDYNCAPLPATASE